MRRNAARRVASRSRGAWSPPLASCRSFNVPSSRARGAGPPRATSHRRRATGVSHIDDILYMDSAIYKARVSHGKTATCRDDAMLAAALLAFHHDLNTESLPAGGRWGAAGAAAAPVPAARRGRGGRWVGPRAGHLRSRCPPPRTKATLRPFPLPRSERRGRRRRSWWWRPSSTRPRGRRMPGDGSTIVIGGSRVDWPGGARTLTPRESFLERNEQTFWVRR